MICGDTSFFFSLYGNDTHSPRAVNWVRGISGPITLGPFNAYELGNALRFAAFRKMLSSEESSLYWAQFESAIQRGRLLQTSCNLAGVLDEATRLSATHTLTGGHRAFDVLHVAAALALGANQFLTFDGNQKILAESEGLKVPF